MSDETFGVVYVAPDNMIRLPISEIEAIRIQIATGAEWVEFRDWGGDRVVYRAARIDGFAVATPDGRRRMRALRDADEQDDNADDTEAWRR